MEIDKYNLEDLIDEKYFYKKISDKYYLNDYQIEVLRRNGIDFKKFGSIKELLFFLDEILLEENIEELDRLSKDLEEFYYYHFINK